MKLTIRFGSADTQKLQYWSSQPCRNEARGLCYKNEDRYHVMLRDIDLGFYVLCSFPLVDSVFSRSNCRVGN